MVFDKQAWVDVKGILRKILHLIREWRLLFKEDRELFFRGADTDTIENRKRLKLSRKGQLPIWMVQPEQMKVNSQVILS
jgi:hypothetical protein